jgi:hypothetical protein
MTEQLEYIDKRLKEVSKYGLIPEVVYFALEAMKSDPSMTVEQALEEGCREWDV